MARRFRSSDDIIKQFKALVLLGGISGSNISNEYIDFSSLSWRLNHATEFDLGKKKVISYLFYFQIKAKPIWFDTYVEPFAVAIVNIITVLGGIHARWTWDDPIIGDLEVARVYNVHFHFDLTEQDAKMLQLNRWLE